MATISATIIKKDRKADQTWNVKIRVWHNSKPAYIDTEHFVSISQLKRKSKESESLVIKDNFILDRVAVDLKKYRDWISDNAAFIGQLSALQLRDQLLTMDKKISPIR